MAELKSSTDRIGFYPVGRLLLDFSIPAIIGMLVNAIYNIVDRIYIGQSIGAIGIAGVYGVYLAFLVSDFCSAAISGIFIHREFKKWDKRL